MVAPEFLDLYPWVVVGVAISVILPILRQALPKPTAGEAGMSGALPRLWIIAKPYLALGLFSCLVGLLVLAVLFDEIGDWRAALIAGYVSDSTIQKLK